MFSFDTISLVFNYFIFDECMSVLFLLNLLFISMCEIESKIRDLINAKRDVWWFEQEGF